MDAAAALAEQHPRLSEVLSAAANGHGSRQLFTRRPLVHLSRLPPAHQPPLQLFCRRISVHTHGAGARHFWILLARVHSGIGASRARLQPEHQQVRSPQYALNDPRHLYLCEVARVRERNSATSSAEARGRGKISLARHLQAQLAHELRGRRILDSRHPPARLKPVSLLLDDGLAH